MQTSAEICPSIRNSRDQGWTPTLVWHTSSVGRLPNRKLGVVPLWRQGRGGVAFGLNKLRFEIPDEKAPWPDLTCCETEGAQSRRGLAGLSAG
jgi:hypothetical protein